LHGEELLTRKFLQHIWRKEQGGKAISKPSMKNYTEISTKSINLCTVPRNIVNIFGMDLVRGFVRCPEHFIESTG
jgi:hypothetical protein